MENTNHTYANVLSSCPEGPVDSGIIYLHSMSSRKITDDFKKNNSISLLHSIVQADIDPPPRCWYQICGLLKKESKAVVIERMKVSEHQFKNTITLSYAQFHLQFALMEVE